MYEWYCDKMSAFCNEEIIELLSMDTETLAFSINQNFGYFGDSKQLGNELRPSH